MFETPVDVTYAIRDPTTKAVTSPLTMNIAVTLHRAPRQKCVVCGHRRVGYWMGAGQTIVGHVLCARCSGIR